MCSGLQIVTLFSGRSLWSQKEARASSTGNSSSAEQAHKTKLHTLVAPQHSLTSGGNSRSISQPGSFSKAPAGFQFSLAELDSGPRTPPEFSTEALKTLHIRPATKPSSSAEHQLPTPRRMSQSSRQASIAGSTATQRSGVLIKHVAQGVSNSSFDEASDSNNHSDGGWQPPPLQRLRVPHHASSTAECLAVTTNDPQS